MILDPDGEVVTESHALGEDVVVTTLTPETYERASGRRYLRARGGRSCMASWLSRNRAGRDQSLCLGGDGRSNWEGVEKKTVGGVGAVVKKTE